MKGKRRLPRAKNPGRKYAIPGAVWNRLGDRLDMLDLHVAAPLRMTEIPGSGTMLECVITPGDTLPPAQYPGMVLVSKTDLTWSAGWNPLHEQNEGV